MKVRLASAVVLILAGAFCLADAPRVVYRTPDSFDRLPADFEVFLEDLGCQIPQGTGDGDVVYKNVVSGELATAGQTDWAVVCSRAGNLSIQVHWGGQVQCASSIDLGMTIAKDQPYEQGINIVDAKFIDKHFQAYGGPTPPNITHLGVEYGFYAKGSTVYYCHGGDWVELTGAD